MHKEILAPEQIDLLPLIKKFHKNFGLVGGTAIALQIGHRRSIDFDLFSLEEFHNANIRKIIAENGFEIENIYQDELGQFTFLVNGVQLTFLHYPFRIKFSKTFEKLIRMPDLLTLAAMKTYALGRRAKWKDYVDLYFILKRYHSLEKVVKRSQAIFKKEFNERIVREQLAYFKDINYTEKIVFRPGFKVSEQEIKKELIGFSLE
ncbi:MAG: nucleotidyl transferase AbiEii/AbiGii toxin family protein [Patescibacteria group bacterium]